MKKYAPGGCYCCECSGTVCVTVKGCCDNPLEGAIVTATGPGEPVECTTDENGYCCLDIPAPETGRDTWTITVTAEGYPEAAEDVEVGCETFDDLEFLLWSPPSTVTVTDPFGAAITLTLVVGTRNIWRGCKDYEACLTVACPVLPVPPEPGIVRCCYVFTCGGDLSIYYPVFCGMSANSMVRDLECPSPCEPGAECSEEPEGTVFGLGGLSIPAVAAECNPIMSTNTATFGGVNEFGQQVGTPADGSTCNAASLAGLIFCDGPDCYTSFETCTRTWTVAG
jgi:hypothetical protein